jgi:hypothetical protein
MDDRRFDALTKSLVSGRSRRSVLKGLLGLGGAAMAGGTLLDGEGKAARRPTPTPRPPSCPGRQTPINGQCVCPADAPFACGPDCCTGEHGDPPLPGHSECCDNACCFGVCYGEELCCPLEDFCPGGDDTEGNCCTDNTTCCRGGTNDRACVDLAVIGNCCTEADCGDPCQVCNLETHTCEPRCDVATEVCCTEQAGPGVCVTGACCLGAPSCGAGEICCQSDGGTVCMEGSTCDPSVCPCENQADCCTINDVFIGCVDLTQEGACCTDAVCDDLDDPGNCLAGVCSGFQCIQRSSCDPLQVCCDGDCYYSVCPDQCGVAFDSCDAGEPPCCEGYTCTPIEGSPDNSSECVPNP